MSGYAHIHRRLLGHPAFRNDAEAMAFAWLVVKASWRQTRVRYKDRIITLERGQLAVSIRDFAKAMDRDKAWVERLMKRLKSETMVKTNDETGVSVITICNYGDYQRQRDTGETPAETPAKTEPRQAQDTEQEREELKKISSVANATGGEPPDPVKDLFDLGVAILTSSGSTEKQARSLIGKWRKGADGKTRDAEVLTALLECRAKLISEPVEWLNARLKPSLYVSPSGYQYRGDIDAVIREAEKRADWGTYWAATKSRKVAA